MGEINIFEVQPHQVSRDLRGYSVFFYGGWKTGKTTTASKFPKSLILAFEKGYSAIPGVKAMPINSWSEFRKVLRQLKDPKAKELYETIIIDTADIAYDYCVKYICDNAPRPKEQGGGVGVDAISDIPFGKGYGMVEKEFDACLREVVKLEFGLVIISHDTDKVFKDESGTEFHKIVPTLDKRANNVCARMCDIVGYSRSVTGPNGENLTKLFMRGTPRYEAGSRFKYTPDVIDFSYQNLVDAIGDAIDKQMEEDGQEYFTESRENVYQTTTEELDYDKLMEEFNSIINTIVENNTEEKFEGYFQPRIIQITERYLGKGQLASKCTRDQVEVLDLIVSELRDLK